MPRIPDESGKFLGASTRTIKGVSDPATLETMACVEALVLAHDLGVSRVHITSDCLEVINMIKTQNLCRYSVILHEIQKRSHDFQEVKFQHEGRDMNGEAHLVARNSISVSFGRRVWLLEPPDFVPAAPAAALGTLQSFCRSVSHRHRGMTRPLELPRQRPSDRKSVV